MQGTHILPVDGSLEVEQRRPIVVAGGVVGEVGDDVPVRRNDVLVEVGDAARVPPEVAEHEDAGPEPVAGVEHPVGVVREHDVVPAAGPPPLGPRGEELEEPPLERAVLAVPRGRHHPGVAVEAERGEEGHEDDVGVGGPGDTHRGAGRGRALLGGEEVEGEPVLDAVLQVEPPRVLRHAAAAPDVGPYAAAEAGGLPVEQAEVELGGQVVHEDPQQRPRWVAFPPGAGAQPAAAEVGAGGGRPARRGVEEKVPGGEEECGGEREEPGEWAPAGGGGGDHGASSGDAGGGARRPWPGWGIWGSEGMRVGG